ncbi:MAG: YfhO family protein [Bacteroidota bacterium]|nr:YfhO family protein [Bacteroidota bacterium]MDP3144846.1 YfhO family protein [Bacteroidota bacterium]
MKFNYKNYLPHGLAIVVFAIITLIYFKPLFSGKELKQDDISRHKGMSKEIVDYRNAHNNAEPLWTNSMFGGMPAYQISTKYPGNWIGKLDNVFKLYIPLPAGYLFLYCLGFFILLLCLDVNPWLALIGGLAYGLSSYFLIILEAGHNSKANALGYLPALLGGVILLFRGKPWLGLSITALFTAMELNANHVQISYYGYILIGFVIAGYFFSHLKQKQLPVFFKGLALFLIATLIGVLPNYGSLATTNEYGKYSTRGKSELTINKNMVEDDKTPLSLDNGGNAKIAKVKGDESLAKKHEKNSTTGLDEDYATQWSYGIGETFTFLIPDFKGGASASVRSADGNALKKVNADFKEQVASSSAYFGDQPFTSGPVYIGAIIILLAMLGMFVVKNTIKWPIFLATALTIALGWGSNFMGLTDFFMHNVPGYNKFRAVSMIMVIAELTLPLLAILALNEIIKIKNWDDKIKLGLIKKEVSLKKLVIISVSVVGGFCAVSYLMPDAVNTFHAYGEEQSIIQQAVRAGNPENQVRPYVAQLMPQLEIARKAIFKADALRSLIFIILGFGALFLYFTNKLKKELFFAAIGIFIAIDLWTVAARYLNDKSFVTKEQNQQSLVAKTAADEEILKDKDIDYRVLNLTVSTFNDAATSYYHKSIGGYHGAKLKKYAELIEFHIDKEINSFYQDAGKAFSSDSAMRVLFSSLNVINMLNTKYFIIPGGGENRTEIPLKNPEANGNAWFVNTIYTVPNADDEIVGLGKINTKTQAIMQTTFKTELGLINTYSGEGTIKLLSYQPNELVYESETKADEFAVFSEIYYPKGWNAYIDGQLKPYAGVNYVLRGMQIPAGKHKIEFKFEPKTYTTGNTIAMIGSILMLITVGVGFYLNKKNNVIVS